jgi:nitrite reductase/ring-hydroxylating ferredoxin subunit
VHDARFVIETGKCVAGPCYGDSLKKLEIEVRNDGVYLQG